jgi:hypothetical protein
MVLIIIVLLIKYLRNYFKVYRKNKDMKGISLNVDGITIKENTDLYHDRVERLLYMSGVIGRPDWQSPINDSFFKNNVDVDDMDDLLNNIIFLLEDEPDLPISAVSGEVIALDQAKAGLKIRFDFEHDKNNEIDNRNLESGFTFFTVYEA